MEVVVVVVVDDDAVVVVIGGGVDDVAEVFLFSFSIVTQASRGRVCL